MKDLSDVLAFTKETTDFIKDGLAERNMQRDEIYWMSDTVTYLMDSLNIIVNAIQEIQSNQPTVVGDKE